VRSQGTTKGISIQPQLTEQSTKMVPMIQHGLKPITLTNLKLASITKQAQTPELKTKLDLGLKIIQIPKQGIKLSQKTRQITEHKPPQRNIFRDINLRTPKTPKKPPEIPKLTFGSISKKKKSIKSKKSTKYKPFAELTGVMLPSQMFGALKPRVKKTVYKHKKQSKHKRKK